MGHGFVSRESGKNKVLADTKKIVELSVGARILFEDSFNERYWIGMNAYTDGLKGNAMFERKMVEREGMRG